MKKGFTLIELLVVIAIIGLLSSVVLASLNTAREKARDTRRLSDIKQIQLAIELYGSDNGGTYFITGNTWGYHSCNSNWQTLETALSKYIPSLPEDPAQNCSISRRYYYRSDNGSDYKILAHQPERPDSPPSTNVVDPRRDGGSDNCKVDSSTNIWSWSVYTDGASCW